MNPREPERPLRHTLRSLHSAHGRALALRVALRAAAFTAIVLTVAVAAGAWPEGEAVAWVRLGLVMTAVVAALAWAIRRWSGLAPRFDAWLETLEQHFPVVRSWLRNALELEAHPDPNTSAELAHAVADETVRRTRALPIATTRPRIEPKHPVLTLAGCLAAIIVGALVLPQPVLRSWRTLWNPTLAAPPLRLEVEPGSVRVSPGAALAVRARVWGSTRRPDLIRPHEGAVTAVREESGPGGGQVWRFDLVQLTRDQTYRVRVGAVSSPEYRIALAGEPTPVSFEVEYQAPAYARLPSQRGAATRGDLSALRGTRARVTVTFDRDLTELTARVGHGAKAQWTASTPRRWQGDVAIMADGEYELHAVAASGEASYRYRMTPLPDAPPVLAVQVPSSDIDLPAGQQIAIELLGQDDLGLSQLRLQHRKDSDAPWTDVPMSHFPAQPREAFVRTTWDASSLALLPGQSASFRFVLEDNNVLSGPGRAVSPAFEVRFPSMADLYDQIDKKQEAVSNSLEKAAQQAREIQKSLDKLSRQPQRATPESTPAFERSEELKTTLERQQDLTKKLDQASEQLQQTLEQATERQAFHEDLQKKLQEMSELMKQIQSDEFREALKRMQEALEKMDRRELEQNLPEWRAQNKDMLQQLERTIDLLKQLRNEEQLHALANRAEELKDRQDALNREHEGARDPKDSKDGKSDEQHAQQLADKQSQAAQESEKLAEDARQLAKQEETPQDQKALGESADQLESETSPAQREASQSARGQQKPRAAQMGKKASESLDQVAKNFENMAKQSEQRRQGADLAAIRRAGQDLVSLQRASEQNMDSGSPTTERADLQTDLAEGVARVADSLYVLARTQPFISPKLGQALGRAMQSLQSSGRDLSTGNRARGEDAGRTGSTSLNEAILELRQTESQMCQSPGQTQGGSQRGSAGEQMGELGKRQGQLNRETQSLAQRLSEQLRLSASDQAQMRKLSEQQRAIREQLEQIQRDDEAKRQLLGRLDQAQREMKEVEETLERGSTDGDLQGKQQRILSRLLDAQRSVNRRDFDPERESRTGQDVTRASAPDLSPDLLRESDRLRLDLLKAEADRYPAQYRAYIEAYLKALNAQPR
jgi:hypothetical protein